MFEEIVNKAYMKLKNHLSYLSERLVALSLFSNEVDCAEKIAVKRCLLKHMGKFNISPTPQENPYSEDYGSKTLKDCVGPDSWRLFSLLQIDT